MFSDTVKLLESHLEALAVAFRGVLEWKWDGRFDAALAEFSVDMKDEVLGILQLHLASSWNSSNVREASDVVREVSKKLGGLMPGQLLLLSDHEPETTACIFCAWWPWGNGQKISIRVAPFGDSTAAGDGSALALDLRRAFEV
jgi:hypothetical protein